MERSAIQAVGIVFLVLLLFVVAFAALARKLQTPYPIVLVVGGLVLSIVPGIPDIELDPDLVFFIVLPPLLYSAAWLTSWREFSYNLVSILSLAVGLVSFTVAGVALTAQWLLPGFDWRTGFVVGAVVSTTDAIAATSIAKRMELPRRIVDVLEGESLVNDATGLLALQFATAMLVRGESHSVAGGALRFAYLSFGGLALGLLIGKVIEWLEHRIDDAPIEIAISILAPYAAYLAAEAAGVSGVLAVVTSGLYLSRKSAYFFSPTVRIQAYAVWSSLTFILNGLVFVLIGLQLPHVLAGIRDHRLPSLLLSAALFSALVIALRLLWSFTAAHAVYFIRRRVFRQNEPTPPARNIFVVGWTGMRGVIALAAALALPQVVADGSPFPHRNLIVFLTFSVILVTLVLQGLTLPPLIRALGLAGVAGRDCEEEEARRIVINAGMAHLERARSSDRPEFGEIYDDLARHYAERLVTLAQEEEPPASVREQQARYRELSRELVQVERDAAIRLRNERRINDEVLRQLERELDLTEARLTATTQK